MVNVAFPANELINAMWPLFGVTVGAAKVRSILAVVCVTSNEVATSTVVAALPIVLLLVWLAIEIELNVVLPVLMNGELLATVRPPFRVPSPVTVNVPPRLVAPLVTVKVLPVAIDVLPLRLTFPPPVAKVPVVLAL